MQGSDVSFDNGEIADTASTLTPQADEKVELEVSVGRFITHRGKPRFDNNITSVRYHRILNHLRRGGNEVVRRSRVTAVDVPDEPGTRIRRIEREGTTRYQVKRRVQDKDTPTFGVRTRLSIEQKIPSTDPRLALLEETRISSADPRLALLPEEKGRGRGVLVRDRERHSFAQGNSKIDLTRVTVEGQDTFELEIEVRVRAGSTRLAVDLAIATQQIISLYEQTEIIYAHGERDRVQSYLETYIREFKDLAQARDLRLDDMTHGRLVGNRDTHYTVAYKADGVRQLLVIYDAAVWLVHPHDSYNKIMRLDNHDLDHFVIDAEMVPDESRLPAHAAMAVPTTKYWLSMFDVLADDTRFELAQATYLHRRSRLDEFMIRWQRTTPPSNTLITVTRKEVFEFETVQEFFALMRRVLLDAAMLPYRHDGLIFTPALKGYRETSRNTPGAKRPEIDLFKWKPPSRLSVDLAVRREGDQIHLEGKKLEAEIARAVDLPTVLKLRDVPQGRVVVEFGYEEGRLVAKKLRPDRNRPNPPEIVRDVWQRMRFPISEATLRGENTVLLRAYHNRIKERMYEDLFHRGGEVVFDIGSGNGQDAGRWQRQIRAGRISHIYAVEPDATHRAELVRRLRHYGIESHVTVIPSGGEDLATIRPYLRNGRVTTVTCMLSLSFFWQSPEKLAGLVRTIQELSIEVGGKVAFLTIDGDALEQTFAPPLDVVRGLARPEIEAGATSELILREGAAELVRIHYTTLSARRAQVQISIEGSHVQNQTEWPVHIGDLQRLLPSWHLTDIYRADAETFLPTALFRFSSLYSYGVLRSRVTAPLLRKPRVRKIAGRRFTGILMDPATVRSPLPVPLPRLPVVQRERPPVPVGVVVDPTPPAIGVADLLLTPSDVATTTATEVATPTVALIATTEVATPTVAVEPEKGGETMLRNLPELTSEILSTPVWSAGADRDPVVRIGAIGDGCCLIHAVLTAFDDIYLALGSRDQRERYAAEIRRDMATLLAEDADTSGLQFSADSQQRLAAMSAAYQNSKYMRDRGIKPRVYDVLPIRENEGLHNPPTVDLQGRYVEGPLIGEMSLNSLQEYLNSSRDLGHEVVEHILTLFLNLNIVLLQLQPGTTRLLRQYILDAPGNQPYIVIGVLDGHFELVGLLRADGVQTVFSNNDPFVQAILARQI